MSQQPIPLFGPEVYNGIEERGLTTDIFTGWHSTHPFIAKIVEEAKPKTYIEVGVWKGGSIIEVCKLAPQLEKAYAVDHWLGGCDHVTAECAFRQGVMRDTHGWPGIYYQFLHNVKVSGFADKVVPVPMLTTDGAKLLALHGIKADLIYIDADHNEGPCAEDIKAYLPLLKDGGYMFGDDFNLPSVQAAVKSVLGIDLGAENSGMFWSCQIK